MDLSVLSEEDPVTGICRSTLTEQVNMGQDDETPVWYFQSAGLAELYKFESTKHSWIQYYLPHNSTF